MKIKHVNNTLIRVNITYNNNYKMFHYKNFRTTYFVNNRIEYLLHVSKIESKINYFII